VRRITLSIVLALMSSRIWAGSGAYVVDDASITPDGKCQAQSWYQLISGGQETLNTLPACSTGPVEWSLGLGAQNDPYEHQESPAIKWMVLDPDHHAIGVAVNVGATWGNGHVLNRNGYVAVTWTPDKAKQWSISTDIGSVYAKGSSWNTLAGLSVRRKLSDQLSVTLERMQHWNGGANTQAGIRWTFHNGDSVDLIAGKSEAASHDHWLTTGLNVAL
jgi:hypothetical protein